MTDKTIQTLENPDTDESSLRYILKLAGPMIVTTISFTVMQTVDRLMVSRLGTEALAAVLPAGFVSFIFGGFAVGVFVSVAVFVSQSLGRGEKQACANYCWQGIYMGVVYSIIVTAVMWPAAPTVFKLMGHEKAVAEFEVIYLRIMLLSNIVAMFVWSISQFFMGIHRPVITMYAALSAQLVNVVANYVLIFGKFGFPQMGIAGAAWGTFIGVSVGAVIRIAVFLGGRINREFKSRQAMGVSFDKMKELLKVGLPAGLELMMNVGLWAVILFWLVGKFGKEAQATTSAVLSCTHVSIMPVVGIKIALSAAVGKAIGSGKKDVAVKQTNTCLLVALIYMGLVGLSFLLLGERLMGIWSSDDKVIEIGVNILICAAIYQVFHAARTVYSGALRGAGDTLWLAMASAGGSVIVLGLGGLITVKLFPSLGSLGPWIAATASIIVVGVANYRRFRSNKWKEIDLFKHRAVVAAIENEAVVK